MVNRPAILLPVLISILISAMCFSSAVIVSEPSPDDGIQQALAALSAGQAERAERLAAEVVADESEGAWRAWLIVASARYRLDRYVQAEKAYRRFLSFCRNPSEQAYVVEQIDRCRMANAESAGPVVVSEQLSARRRVKLSTVDNRRFTESSEHFVVRAHNSDLAKLIVKQAEIALGRICRIILSGQDYPHSVSIYVWPNVTEYSKHAVTAPEWSGGSFSLRQGDNGQIIRRIDLTQLGKDGLLDTTMLDRVLPHEMCHLVQAEFFGDSPSPLMLSEGLAMMAEARVDNSRVLLVGAALAGDEKIPLQKLLGTDRCDAENAAVFYAESFSLTAYLHKRMTPGQFGEMLNHIKTGCPLDEAIQRSLYVPESETFMERLSAAWEAEALRQWQFLKALEK
ncbi:MAG: peptidase MA family metallohydrolase [Planctomycetota bacterium]|nr:peptidase MA family metallohydrolase [Planctomycetota bacterium]